MSSSSSSSSDSGSAAEANGGTDVDKSLSDQVLDGRWSKGCIDGSVLRWNTGSTSELVRKSPREFSMVRKNKEYTARLENDGKLHWSDGDVWSRLEADAPESKLPEFRELQENPDIPEKEKKRLVREAMERIREKEQEERELANVYVGKPHLPAACDGGGWGGPKEGYDMDQRYMLRGEYRELPDHIYKSWKDNGRILSSTEQQMTAAGKMSGSGSGSESDSSSEEEKKKKKNKGTKKKKKDKQKKVKGKKKGKQDKKKNKGKKEKGKKDKKGGNKKQKTA
eukprot:TRINITY_DN6459_c1_g1_i1.p1 TRINITY_DN6459_c1_g1~~TRINITY_DN6459_c1_g1_i1.p1  ORF type:complete len:281 (+),score=77.83 TRINITY_DN6459_c1_g1_i1:21-863(+)